MTADDQVYDQSDQSMEDTELWEEILAENDDLTPFEDVWDTDHNPASSTRKTLAQKFSSPDLRYLLQLSTHRPADREQADAPQSTLAVLSRSIKTLGGRIEHHWCTPNEYDVILVIGLHSRAISIDTYEMALKAIPMVKSVRITPLLPLDQPPEEPALQQSHRTGGDRVRPERAIASEPVIDQDGAFNISDSIEFGDD